MYVEQLYTKCLAQAAYYIESDGEAAIVDPLRDVGPYLELAKSRGARIRYILETHFHADFVSGQLDLARATGAPIVFGPGARTEYRIHEAKDGEVLHLGKITIKVMHTPGHTPESVCYLLRNEEGKEYALFSGDTLFVDDVGRPDLLDGVVSKEKLASMMYDSLHERIAALPDDILLYPAHGPGSACGKNIGSETWSTLGDQKRRNHALQPMSRGEFVSQLIDNLPPAPRYYFSDAAINKKGYRPLEEVTRENCRPLSLAEFEASMKKGAIVLDTRHQNDFERGHVPLSINIGLDGSFAMWVGSLMSIESTLVLIAPVGREEESVRRLARIGYENVLGYLEGGFESWHQSHVVDTVTSIEPKETRKEKEKGKTILDVRRPGEFETSHIEGAVHIPLASLQERISELDPETEYVIHCAAGYRSMIAASILKRYGFQHLENVHGGFSKIKNHIPELIVSGEPVSCS